MADTRLVIIEDGDAEAGQSLEGQEERAEGQGERAEGQGIAEALGEIAEAPGGSEVSEAQTETPDAARTEQQLNENQNKNVSEPNEQKDEEKPEEERLREPEPDVASADLQDFKKAHRLSPDFPDSLFELLCTLQEGRRLNDQRCSFIALEPRGRRRCHSEPNTTKPAPEREEFFDLVATAQARRLNDQRAQLQRSAPQKNKSRSFRGSLRQLSLKKPEPPPEPAPAPKEELYSMILHTQAQGRLEDQRSRAPGPMDDEVFFSLLLRVQGGRMDEQRTELPCLLHT